MSSLLVIAKTPVPGRVKTRLCPPLRPEEAADLALAALRDTLDTVLAVGADHSILLLDGEPGAWVPPEFEVVPQVTGTLDIRLAAGFAAVGRIDAGPALLVGMDTPQLDSGLLSPSWQGHDAVFGPAEDGGFWSIGFTDPTDPRVSAVLTGVPMSRSDTGEIQLGRLHDAGMSVAILPALRDVDTAVDALHVASLAPATRFAKKVAECQALFSTV